MNHAHDAGAATSCSAGPHSCSVSVCPPTPPHRCAFCCHTAQQQAPPAPPPTHPALPLLCLPPWAMRLDCKAATAGSPLFPRRRRAAADRRAQCARRSRCWRARATGSSSSRLGPSTLPRCHPQRTLCARCVPGVRHPCRSMRRAVAGLDACPTETTWAFLRAVTKRLRGGGGGGRGGGAGDATVSGDGGTGWRGGDAGGGAAGEYAGDARDSDYGVARRAGLQARRAPRDTGARTRARARMHERTHIRMHARKYTQAHRAAFLDRLVSTGFVSCLYRSYSSFPFFFLSRSFTRIVSVLYKD